MLYFVTLDWYNMLHNQTQGTGMDNVVEENTTNDFTYWAIKYSQKEHELAKLKAEHDELKTRAYAAERAAESMQVIQNTRNAFVEHNGIQDFMDFVNRHMLVQANLLGNASFHIAVDGEVPDDALVFYIKGAKLSDDLRTIEPIELLHSVRGTITINFYADVIAEDETDAEEKVVDALSYSSLDSSAFYSDNIVDGSIDEWSMEVNIDEVVLSE